MNPKELKELATKIVMNQTNQALLTDSLEQIIKAYEENYTVKETLQTELEKKNDSIKALQDTNMKFFTQLQTQHQQQTEEQEEEKELSTEELAKLFI